MSQNQQTKRGVPNSSPNAEEGLIQRFTDWADSHLRSKPDEIKEVLENERNWIKQRRDKVKARVDRFNENKAEENKIYISTEEPAKTAVGLALSGGGIRSATFNLGLLQAFERYKLLWHVDYMSTVSGGGYIGSSLTWFKSITATENKSQNDQSDPNDDHSFPFGTQRRHHAGIGGKVLAWLRSYGYYLTPGNGLTIWSLITAVITGTLLNLVILVPPVLLVFYLLSRRPISFPQPLEGLNQLIFPCGEGIGLGFVVLMIISLAALAAFLLMIAVYVLSTIIPWKRMRGFMAQRHMRAWAGCALMYGVLFAVIGSIPLVHGAALKWIPNWIEEAMSAFSVTGIASILGALKGRKGGNEARGFRSFFLSIGLALLSYGIFLWFYYIMGYKTSIAQSTWYWVVLVISFVLAILADTNQISMHRYYRNRLMEAYMPYSIEGAGKQKPPNLWYPYATPEKADDFRISNIAITDAPYHIINTNLQTIGSKNPILSRRGGDNFIISPRYCGSISTGFILTNNYVGGDMDLATAFAISGAAVDPNTYATRSRPLSFLMTLLNIRLGYWIANPKKFTGGIVKPLWWIYMFREMLGRGLTENCAQIHLSDGGHFENLGLYELVHRRCRYIIVADAAADPKFSFADLAKVIEMVRVDFGAEIDIDVSHLQPQGDDKDKRSKLAFARGTISYNAGEDDTEAIKADLLYIKTAVIDNLREDIYGYRRAHDKFPDETTADQFFSEPQFEAYRELGFLLGSLACGRKNVNKMDSFFECIDEYIKTAKTK